MLMHERRIEFTKSIRHAFKYISQIAVQTIANFIHILKGQQIFQLVVCGILALLFNIYFQVIPLNLAAANIFSFLYFVAALLFLVAILSFVTAPFALDRELQEIVSELEDTKPNMPVENSFIAPNRTPTVKPNFDYVEAKIFRAELSQLDVIERSSTNSHFQAFSVEFASKPSGSQDVGIRVKAIITFKNLENENSSLTRVKSGIWLGQKELFKTFHTGDSNELVIAIAAEQFYAYEHHLRNIRINTFLQPNLIPLDGESFEVNIELLGKYSTRDVLQQTYTFRLDLKPKPKFEFLTMLDESKNLVKKPKPQNLTVNNPFSGYRP